MDKFGPLNEAIAPGRVSRMDPKLVLVVAPMTRVVGYENGAIACQGVN